MGTVIRVSMLSLKLQEEVLQIIANICLYAHMYTCV